MGAGAFPSRCLCGETSEGFIIPRHLQADAETDFTERLDPVGSAAREPKEDSLSRLSVVTTAPAEPGGAPERHWIPTAAAVTRVLAPHQDRRTGRPARGAERRGRGGHADGVCSPKANGKTCAPGSFFHVVRGKAVPVVTAILRRFFSWCRRRSAHRDCWPPGAAVPGAAGLQGHGGGFPRWQGR